VKAAVPSVPASWQKFTNKNDQYLIRF